MGMSPLFGIDNLGGDLADPKQDPAILINLVSFQFNMTPEPSVVTLGILAATAFFLVRVSKK
jgi:hypothetical protein